MQKLRGIWRHLSEEVAVTRFSTIVTAWRSKGRGGISGGAQTCRERPGKYWCFPSLDNACAPTPSPWHLRTNPTWTYPNLWAPPHAIHTIHWQAESSHLYTVVFNFALVFTGILVMYRFKEWGYVNCVICVCHQRLSGNAGQEVQGLHHVTQESHLTKYVLNSTTDVSVDLYVNFLQFLGKICGSYAAISSAGTLQTVLYTMSPHIVQHATQRKTHYLNILVKIISSLINFLFHIRQREWYFEGESNITYNTV